MSKVTNHGDLWFEPGPSAPEPLLLTLAVIFKEVRLEGTLKEGDVPDRNQKA